MWSWATSSRHRRRPPGRAETGPVRSRGFQPRGRATAGLAVLVALLAVVVAPPASAKVFMTADEALELAYPGCQVERDTVFLTREQLAEARRLSGEEIRSSLVHPYRVTCPPGKGGAAAGGTAYFDVHRVRTLEETLMIALDASGAVKRIEVLSFREPEDYLPREVFYQQYEGKTLGPDLQLKRDIRNVTGATLTARATTEATRRVLALHRVVGGG